MNYKRIALGLLCGLLCVAPAFAGVVDADLTKTTEKRDKTHLTSRDVDNSKVVYKATATGEYAKQKADGGGTEKWGNLEATGSSNTSEAEAKANAIYDAYRQMWSEVGRNAANGKRIFDVDKETLMSEKHGWVDRNGNDAFDNAEWIRKDGGREKSLGGYSYFSTVERSDRAIGGEFFAWKVTGSTDNGGKITTEKKTQEDYKAATVTTTNYLFVGDVDDFSNTYEIGGTKNIVHHDAWWNETNGTVTKTFQINVFGYVSPIVLDLDGDGVIEASKGQYLSHPKSFAYDSHVAMFDFKGNGFPMLTEWVGENDGLLCRPEADGSVKGVNLFGIANGSENGYDDMALLDANKSGALEGAELEGLYVWQDRNCNGIADKGELSTVQSLGITSISVKHDNMASTFVRNGQTFKSFDWWPSVMDVRQVKISSF